MNSNPRLAAGSLALLVLAVLNLSGCSGSSAPTGISPEKFADGVYAVMKADRTVYAQQIVTRLQKQGATKVVPLEEWKDWEDDWDYHALPLPAQVFRMGASLVDENPDAGFRYSLKSLWPLNPQHKPQSDQERKALRYLVDNPGETKSIETTINGRKMFVKYFPDRAVAEACWTCHNEHTNKEENYPEFKKNDVMGGVAVYIPLP